jgi:hypothetical protein
MATVKLVSAKLIPTKSDKNKFCLILSVTEGTTVQPPVFHDVAEADLAKSLLNKHVTMLMNPYLCYRLDKVSGEYVPDQAYKPMIILEEVKP